MKNIAASLKGTFRARKLAKETGRLCNDIVNYLITNGYHIKLPDTAYIFQESYSFCLFLLSKESNLTLIGSMIYTAEEPLKEWLNKIFSQSNRDYDFNQSIETLFKELPKFYNIWITQLSERHKELIGQNIYSWAPSAIIYYMDSIDSYIHIKFENSPYDFKKFIYKIAENCAKRCIGFK